MTPWPDDEVLALFILSSSVKLPIKAVDSLVADFMRQGEVAPLVQALLCLHCVRVRN